MIKKSDSLQYLKTLADYSQDIIYCDPPYALGSEVIIRKDGKVDYAKASDFMSKWEMPTGAYWEEWFKEAYRVLKHGGWLIMFGMDRQLLLFKYYAHLSEFEEQQSLYWYFISNFPKATDLSKMIDKNAGAEREVIGKRFDGKGSDSGSGVYAMNNGNSDMSNEINITKPTTELAKKYDGYKYSISPLKQTNETIMVFKKPTKTGSVLHDTLAYENGDKTITVGALNIDGNRIETTDDLAKEWNRKQSLSMVGGTNTFVKGLQDIDLSSYAQTGRYPAQTFIDSSVSKALDKQSETYSMSEEYEGGCSKILNKCDYEQEDIDLYYYEPKVSSSERNAGCDGMEEKPSASSEFRPNHTEKALNGENGNPYGRWKPLQNNHPTLKPIELNYRILSLFKTPNNQVICYPFAGAGSEIIGGIKAGFENWHGCEINQEYVDIANARIEYWKKTMWTQTDIFSFLDKEDDE